MMTWNYRIFREENGDYIIREVFYEEDGSILGVTEKAVEPFGRSLAELTASLQLLQEALTLPVLTLADIPGEPKQKRKKYRSKYIAHEQLKAELGLTDEPTPIGAEAPASST